MKLTCHSESAPLHTIFIKHVQDAFVDDATIDREWEILNYTGRPNLEKAIAEYTAFEALIKDTGAIVHYLPKDETVSMDSMYCRDAAIATDYGMILCNMGKDRRKPEPFADQQVFMANNITVLGAIQAPGTVEGGDVAWLDNKTLAVGHSYRTNEEGIRQLRALLSPYGITVLSFSLPHYKGPSDVFHLMSIFSPVDQDLAVVYSPLMPIAFRNTLLDRGYAFVEVPPEEFEMACNVLALAPRQCLMLQGFPQTQKALEAAGCMVLEYAGAEISVKGGGGPTCLTRPIWRGIE